MAFDSDATDILIRLGVEPGPADIVAHRLFDSVLIPVCSPTLLETGPPLGELGDFMGHTLLYSELRSQVWPRWLAMAGLPAFERFKSQRFESNTLVHEAAAEGLGVALGELAPMGDDLRKRRLITPIPLSQTRSEGFYLVYRRQARRTSHLREFSD